MARSFRVASVRDKFTSSFAWLWLYQLELSVCCLNIVNSRKCLRYFLPSYCFKSFFFIFRVFWISWQKLDHIAWQRTMAPLQQYIRVTLGLVVQKIGPKDIRQRFEPWLGLSPSGLQTKTVKTRVSCFKSYVSHVIMHFWHLVKSVRFFICLPYRRCWETPVLRSHCTVYRWLSSCCQTEWERRPWHLPLSEGRSGSCRRSYRRGLLTFLATGLWLG